MMDSNTDKEAINKDSQKMKKIKIHLWHMTNIIRKIDRGQNPEEGQIQI